MSSSDTTFLEETDTRSPLARTAHLPNSQSRSHRQLAPSLSCPNPASVSGFHRDMVRHVSLDQFLCFSVQANSLGSTRDPSEDHPRHLTCSLLIIRSVVYSNKHELCDKPLLLVAPSSATRWSPILSGGKAHKARSHGRLLPWLLGCLLACALVSPARLPVSLPLSNFSGLRVPKLPVS